MRVGMIPAQKTRLSVRLSSRIPRHVRLEGRTDFLARVIRRPLLASYGASDMTRTVRMAGLSLVALTAFALTVLPARDVRSQDEKLGDKPSPIEGAWKSVEQKNGEAQAY